MYKDMGRILTKLVCPIQILSLLGLLCASCDNAAPVPLASFDRIREEGRIVMVTQNSANTYYIYREQPMGFEYDLAMEYARYLGVELEVVTPNWLQMFGMLAKRQGDFIAAGVTIVPSRRQHVDFSVPYFTVRQHLILHESHPRVESIEDLSGMTIHVRAGTSYQERLAEIQGMGVELKMVLIPDVLTEDLIRQVAEGEIEATIADSNIAMLNRRHYPEIKIGVPVSKEQSLAWAVKKGDFDLIQSVNAFLTRVASDGTLTRIRGRYYDDRNLLEKLDVKTFHNRMETRLPLYDSVIKATALEYGFDWRLIAAMIYQESHFDPEAQSHTGVRGIMQVTGKTAAEMGIDNRLDPEQSIRAGVKYLAHLFRRFGEIEDPRNRLLFALSSYNVGYGHVRDAQKIARERGLDPMAWASMRQVLPLLSRPEYYRETRYGYARGKEPVRYVNNVLTYYDIMIGKMKSATRKISEEVDPT